MNRAICHMLTCCVAAFRNSKTTCCHTHCRSMRAASVVGIKLTEGTFHVTRLSLCSHESQVMSVKKCTMFVEFIPPTSTFFTSFQLHILPMTGGRGLDVLSLCKIGIKDWLRLHTTSQNDLTLSVTLNHQSSFQ